MTRREVGKLRIAGAVAPLLPTGVSARSLVHRLGGYIKIHYTTEAGRSDVETFALEQDMLFKPGGWPALTFEAHIPLRVDRVGLWVLNPEKPMEGGVEQFIFKDRALDHSRMPIMLVVGETLTIAKQNPDRPMVTWRPMTQIHGRA